MKEVDDDISHLNSTEENLKSNNECYSQEINRIEVEIQELDKITSESSILDVVEKYR